MKKTEVSEESELDMVAQFALDQFSKAPAAGAQVLGLRGELGAGKTAFVKALARRLGVAEDVTSPTFVIMKFYECGEGQEKKTPFDTLVHIDAYRVESPDEMRVLHFEDVQKEPRTLICIEWAERVEPLLPDSTMYMDFSMRSDGTREIIFS